MCMQAVTGRLGMASAFWCLATALVLGIFTRPVQAETTFAVTDLGVLPGGAQSVATAINASGVITGTSTGANGIGTPFIYANGQMTSLGFSPAEGTAINNLGQITGYSGAGPVNAFVYSAGHTTVLNTLGGSYTDGEAINDLGQVAGSSDISGTGQTRHAILNTGGQTLDLGTLGGSQSYAHGINNAGQIVGESYLAGGNEHAFLDSNGQMMDLGTIDGNAWSFAYAINASGQITGSAEVQDGALGTEYHAFLYSAGVMQDLGKLAAYPNSSGRAINSAGDIVGFSYTNSGIDHAFLYTNGSMSDLNTLIDPASGWTVGVALGINDSDQIVGSGTNALGQQHALLLTPVEVPEPASLAAPCLCILVMLVRSKAPKRLAPLAAQPGVSHDYRRRAR
jgi:probable HAF family extracellular repeat protein